jgi:hypothetical protein
MPCREWGFKQDLQQVLNSNSPPLLKSLENRGFLTKTKRFDL